MKFFTKEVKIALAAILGIVKHAIRFRHHTWHIMVQRC